MKSTLVAAALLVLAVPATAATARPADRALIERFERAHGFCVYSIHANHPTCDEVAGRLAERLTAKGYCIYGHGVVGKRGGTHCYTIK
jgi:hypothetical protein